MQIGRIESLQCENVMIFLSFRFYVKSILENLEVLKLPLFAILLIWSISAFNNCKHTKKSKFRASKCVKMADFVLLEPPKLISRKNWSDRKIMKFPHCEVAAS